MDQQSVLEQQALEQLRRGDLRAAHRTLSMLVQFRPADEALRRRIAQVEQLVRQREEAQERIQAEPLRYAHAYIQAGRLAEGLQLLRAALARDPNNQRLRELALEVARRLREQVQSQTGGHAAVPQPAVDPHAQLRAQQEAQLRAQQEAQLRAQQEAQQRAQQEAELRAQQEAQLRAQQEAQLRAQQEAQLRAQEEAQRRAQQEAQLRAEQEARLRAQREAEILAQREAEQRAQQEAERRAREEAARQAQLRAEQEARAAEEARLRAQAEAERIAAEDRARQEAARAAPLPDNRRPPDPRAQMRRLDTILSRIIERRRGPSRLEQRA